MRTIAHVSDLHFGREDPRAAEALLADVNAVAPALVAVSGDLTQRARVAEFAKARAWLARIAAPLVVVPGNHDVPLYDLLRRFAQPLARFRAYVTPELEPVYADEELVAIGISTARSLTWKGGRISWEQMDRVRRLLCAPGPERLHVLVAHHPFSPPDASPRERLVGRAASALAVFGGCGLDLVLTGHLHRGFAGGLHPRGHTVARSVLALHAGSAISHRLRGETNSYNLVRVMGRRVDVEVRAFGGERFEPLKTYRFTRTGEGWVPLAPLEESAPPAAPPAW
jgi:3',5'-cyclic AMP phosphodiesterase CpdA